MKRFQMIAIISMLLMGMAAWAQPKESAANAPAFPGALSAARYVYVSSYDGSQFNPDTLLDDQKAVGAVQDALRKWGKLMVVTRRSEADIVILVLSRPSEDVLAVYDGRQPLSGNYLWRVTAPGGLQAGETPLVTQFEKAFEGVQKYN